MAYECEILRDSVSDHDHRLTTFVITFPRFILAEVNTHRMLSRNSASSRAIPVAKSIEAVREDPFIPESFGRNQKGMQAGEDLDEEATTKARTIWNAVVNDALWAAEELDKLEVHKALANRILEPAKWHTAVVTATDWSNFFALRTHPDAQPEFRKIALMMKDAYEDSTPQLLTSDQWHLPFVSDEEWQELPEVDHWKAVSIGRCARVSYLTHFGVRDPQADIALTVGRLIPSGHLSPCEHVARPFVEEEWDLVDHLNAAMDDVDFDSLLQEPFLEYLRQRIEYQGNLHGWHSARMEIAHEDDFSAI